MHLLIRVILWNVVFVVFLTALVFFCAVWVEHWFPGVGRGVSDAIGLSVPFVVGCWLLLLGAKFAKRRASVIAVAVVSSVLVLIQCALLEFFILYSQGFDNTRSTIHFELLPLLVLATGVALVWWFTSVRLPNSKSMD